MTPEQKVFIVENRLAMTDQQIANKLSVNRGAVSYYIRKNEIKPPADVINERRNKAISKGETKERGIAVSKTLDNAYDYARHLGYNNVSEGFKDLGKPKFMRQFRNSAFNSKK